MSGVNVARGVVCLLAGPTASGKSAVALELCRRGGWELLSCDGGQARRGFSIGTAAPSEAERGAVVHHLVGDLDPCADDSVALFLDRAARILATPGPDLVAAGGTGQFLSALLRGLAPVPPPDPLLRAELAARLASEGREVLLEELVGLDPAPPRDAGSNPVRLLRALEKAILRSRGVVGEGRPALAPETPVFALSWPREALHARIEARARGMLVGGWPEEARALAKAVPSDAPAWKAIGYRELAALPPDEDPLRLLPAIAGSTRAYARRQETWIRGQLGARFLSGDRAPSEIAEAILAELAGRR